MTKVNWHIRQNLAQLFLLGLCFASAGCISTTQHRVDVFMFTGTSYIEKTITDFERGGLVSILISTKLLPHGKFENEYGNVWMRKLTPGTKELIYQCHFFYEYEPESKIIVKFRFEEKVKNACQLPGV